MEATVLIRTASGSMHHYRPLTSSADHDSSLFFGSTRSPRSTITVHFDRRSSSPSSSASPPESCSHSAPLRRSRSDACAAIRSAKWSESTRIINTENEDKEDLLVVLDSAGSSRIGTGSTKGFFLDTASTSDKAASARGAVVEEEVEFSGSGGAGRGRKIGGGGRGNGNSSGGGSAGGEMGAYYKEMLRADPGNPLFLRNYGKFLQEVEGDVEGAEECYGRALLASPGDGEVLSLYGNLMWEAHRDEKRAEDYYQRAVQASPDDSYVLGSYAHFLWDAEEVEEEEEEEEMSTATASSSSMSSSNGVMVKAF